MIELEREEDGRWIAEMPSLPGVMAYGRTRGEAVRNVLALAWRVKPIACTLWVLALAIVCGLFLSSCGGTPVRVQAAPEPAPDDDVVIVIDGSQPSERVVCVQLWTIPNDLIPMACITVGQLRALLTHRQQTN